MTKLFLIFCTIAVLTQVQASYINELYNNGKLYIDDYILMNDLETKRISILEEDQIFIDKQWDRLLDKITDAKEVYVNLEKAPEKSFFSADKESLRKDLNRELSELLFMITEDKTALKYISIVDSLRVKISIAQADITRNKELSLLSRDADDQADYREKNILLKSNIKHYEANIEKVKEALQFNLSSAGVDFTIDQITVLLSRVDVNDIIQLTLVYNNLKPK